MRKPISTRLRFEIFKRDGFRCVYCGATPVQRPLHVDHVLAVANGGTNEPSNLVTACPDCNLGKSAVPLERKALGGIRVTPDDKDHAKQILEYLALQREIEMARTEVADVVADRWVELIGPLTQDMYDRLKKLVREWPIERLDEAMRITARKMGDPGSEFGANTAIKQSKYFQGILRNWRDGVDFSGSNS